MLRDDLKHWFTLLLGVCVTLYGQAEMFPEPYRHWITLAGMIAMVFGGYKITPSGSVKI